MEQILKTMLGTYNYGRMKYTIQREIKKHYDNIGFIYNHLEDLGIDKKKINKIIKLIMKYPKLMNMNAYMLLFLVMEYFI